MYIRTCIQHYKHVQNFFLTNGCESERERKEGGGRERGKGGGGGGEREI